MREKRERDSAPGESSEEAERMAFHVYTEGLRIFRKALRASAMERQDLKARMTWSPKSGRESRPRRARRTWSFLQESRSFDLLLQP
jgi:hypothetical protein